MKQTQRIKQVYVRRAACRMTSKACDASCNYKLSLSAQQLTNNSNNPCSR